MPPRVTRPRAVRRTSARRLALESFVDRLEMRARSPPVRCAIASCSSQSASRGLRGSSGPWRYVPIARPSRQPSKPALAVVAVAGDDAPERLGAASRRAARMVLEAGDRGRTDPSRAGRRRSCASRRRPSRAGAGRRPAFLAVEALVARGRAAGSRRRRQGARRRPRRPPRSAARPSRQGSRRRGTARGPDRRRRSRGRARPGRSGSSIPIGRHVEVVAAPGSPPREHGDVAAIGVDVEVVGVEMADADRRHATASGA